MEFSPEAKTVLGILNYHTRKDKRATLETLSADDEWKKGGKDDQCLTSILDQLVDRGLVSQTGDRYLLTEQGSAQVK